MKLFDMSRDARRCYVAQLLKFNPNEPLNEVTTELIDHLLDVAETTAQQELEKTCYHMLNP